MNIVTRTTSVAVLVTLGLTLTARAAELPPAAQVLKETGVSAGLAVVVGTTDGALESELARAKFVVQAKAASTSWKTTFGTINRRHCRRTSSTERCG